MRIFTPVVVLALGAALSACDQGSVTVLLTDAPADTVRVLELGIVGVALEAEDGSSTDFAFDPPRVIDIAALRNGTRVVLLDDVSIDSGNYRALRLRFDTREPAPNAFPVIRDDGTRRRIRFVRDNVRVAIDFRIPDMGSETLIADIDLRRSIVETDQDLAEGRIGFDPVARAVIANNAGRIEGTIGESIAGQAGCVPAIYAYRGTDVTPGTLSSGNRPFSSVLTTVTGFGNQASYTLRDLPAGDYTLAVTCDALADAPDNDDFAVSFIGTRNTRVNAGETTTEVFAP